MEAHGSPVGKVAQQVPALLPEAHGREADGEGRRRPARALYTAIDIVRRGGTISLIGVYGGMTDPMPMLTMFDKQIQLRMGRPTSSAGSTTSCRCSSTSDPLGVEGFATHRVPLERRPRPTRVPEEAATAWSRSLLQPAAAPQAVDPSR